MNSHTSAFRTYDITRKKDAELNANFQRKVGSNGKKIAQNSKKIEDLLGGDEETEKMKDMTVKYGLAAASDALLHVASVQLAAGWNRQPAAMSYSTDVAHRKPPSRPPGDDSV